MREYVHPCVSLCVYLYEVSVVHAFIVHCFLCFDLKAPLYHWLWFREEEIDLFISLVLISVSGSLH